MNKVMVLKGGSSALHILGDIGRKEDDYIRVHKEDDTYYIGNFEEGFGFIDVKFQKSDCRNLTQPEIDDLNKKWFAINGQALYKINLDNEGNIVQLKQNDN